MFDLQGREWQMLEGAGVTVQLLLATLPFLVAFGLIGALAKLSAYRVFRGLGEAYTTIIRGIPELVIILLIYFGGTIAINALGYFLVEGGGVDWGLKGLGVFLYGEDARIDISPFWAGVMALSLVHGAFATEVFRAAFLAVPHGEVEAAQACGMSTWQIFHRIRLPQVWRFALPGIGNLFQVLIKDTALISVVGLEEIMRKAQVGAGAEKLPFTFYLAAMAMFLVLTTVALVVFSYLERRAARGVRRA